MAQDIADPTLRVEYYCAAIFAPVTETAHPTIETVLCEWVVCPDDDIENFFKARYVYFHNV
jgi:hypothetical protein